MEDHPIARCAANDVEAWSLPFYISRAQGVESTFLYLEDHLYNLEAAERAEILPRLVKIDSEADLEAAGYSRDTDGVWIIA